MQISAFLELLYSAPGRSESVRATVRRSFDEEQLREILSTQHEYHVPEIPAEEGPWEAPPSRIEATTRIWAARPHLVRWETYLVADGRQAGFEVGVKDGAVFWLRSENGELHTNQRKPTATSFTTPEETLLEPRSLLGVFEFEVGGKTSRLGRSGIQAHATLASGGSSQEFAPATDELNLVVDRERGVLLEVSALAAGHEIARCTIIEIAFDESIPVETFRLES
jgi:outer membrane lipoprotein-sorting protein